LAAYSPSGEAAAFYWRDNNRLEVHAGLPGPPRLTAIDVAGEWTAMMVSGDGQYLAGVSKTGGLWLLLNSGRSSHILIHESDAIAAVSFLRDHRTLAIAEQNSDRIELISDLSVGALTRRIAALPAPIGVGARFLPDQDWLLLDPAARKGYRGESSGFVRTLDLQLPATDIDVLRPPGAILLRPSGAASRIVVSGDQAFTWHYLPGHTAASSKMALEHEQ
jgi:hypothetical protein